jgi:hypothetical protein
VQAQPCANEEPADAQHDAIQQLRRISRGQSGQPILIGRFAKVGGVCLREIQI